ncbi:MAG TPA: carbohydrate kinase family protein, partial [Candidatus Omnitrophica bacterium]|nr:carbohydrate kinase family protein [Candidatus Omnitrophota bacterium]
KSLRAINKDLVIKGFGVVGDDEDGKFILEDLQRSNIDSAGIIVTKEALTSYTDVITVKDTGVRTFFHNRGANALFSIEHVDIPKIDVEMFHFGYLLLLDKMDSHDEEYETVAARFLSKLKEKGIFTSVDVVSESSDRFSRIIPPALKYTDLLVINEIEAGKISGVQIRKNGEISEERLKKASQSIAQLGNNLRIVIHSPEMGYYFGEDGELVEPSIKLPSGFIKGTVGAGDAFCAGILYGISREWPMKKSLQFAHLSACCCLSHPTSTGGMCSEEEIWQLGVSLKKYFS